MNFQARESKGQWKPAFALSPSIAADVIAELEKVRARRNGLSVRRALEGLARAADEGKNTLPALIDAARARASIGEITEALAEVFGRHTSSAKCGEPLPRAAKSS